MRGNSFALSDSRGGEKGQLRLYKMRVAIAPCLCCGQDDHALVNVYGLNGMLYTERVVCPVSQYEKSLNRIAKEDGEQRFGAINPWKFVQMHGKDERTLSNAWDKYRILGFGRSRSMKRNLFEWKAVLFFARPDRKMFLLEETNDNNSGNIIDDQLVWPRDRWIPSGPPIRNSERPLDRRPCVLCGADEHSAEGWSNDGDKLTRECPLFDHYDKETNSVKLCPDTFAEISGFEVGTAEDTVDKFQFQGMAWELDLDIMDEFRKRVLGRCREVRAGWTFKRSTIANIGSEDFYQDNEGDYDESSQLN